ncbi:MAG: electron transport complex subunit RsxC [Rikenellaceae bacterium]
MSKTFRIGGVHPPENKISKAKAIVEFPIPETVVIPLSQHIGAPAVACVAKGDVVKVGQIIATAGGFVSSNIHSSVSGKVTSIDAILDGGGLRKPAITIKVEGDEWAEGIDLSTDLVTECSLTPAEIVKKIAEAGIVGMGGATFPTQVKLSVPEGKTAEYLILNGVECEPYLTSDHRVMLEHGQEMIVGVQILAKALGVKKSYVGIEENKPDAIKHLQTITASMNDIEIVPLHVQYPQGGEKQLIDAVISRQVPSGKLPIDVQAVVQNVSTALAVYHAVQKNLPLISRTVTVTGKSMTETGNFKVRIGTPISALLAYCGGLPEDTGKVINGGPMMGRSMCNLESSVTKGTSGILVMNDKEAKRNEAASCIKCAKCVSVCPMALEPFLISKMAQKSMFEALEDERVADCIECGSCSYICPASLPLLDYIRIGKGEVMKIMRARAAK